jgi:sortase A
MKKKLINILLVLLLLLGVGLLLYPTVSDYWNSFHQSRAIASYAESVSNIDSAVYEELWTAAGAYNQTLVGKANPFFLSEEERKTYKSLLDTTGTGIMGYISIPAINCSLPIYHGTDEAVLQIAVGHLEGSSLPVGGPSTHSILSGHRGLPSAKLFTNLDQLGEGDVFLLQILNEVLTYEVDQIRIVLPTELDELYITQGQDYCTLVTCTPYGVNSHRLLVRGHRTANRVEEAAVRVTAEALRIDPVIVAPIAAIPMLLVLVAWTVTRGPKKKKKTPGRAGKGKPRPSSHTGSPERQGPDHEDKI